MLKGNHPMKTTNEPTIAPEEKSSKAGLFFTALALAALMVSAVVGGAAFTIYRQFSTMPGGEQASTAHQPPTTRLAKSSTRVNQDHPAGAVPMNRRVAAEASDRSDFRYADNTVLPPAAARRVIAAWRSNPVVSNVPPPLMKTAQETSEEASNVPPEGAPDRSNRVRLTDPNSRYIIGANGRVIGVDGSAGAAAEARRQQAVPVAAPVQTPPMEVRVAVPVQVRAAIPVTPGEEDVAAQAGDGYGYTNASQYVPVRRAQPAVANARSFDAASYLSRQDDLRGQLNVNPTSRAAGYRYDFRLPESSNR